MTPKEKQKSFEELVKLKEIEVPIELDEKLELAVKAIAEFGGIDPPPWNTYEHPEKTKGWLAYQEYLREKHG